MNDLLLSYYGDDFTGSTDVMESLTFSGLRTVLFLDPPSPSQVEALGDARAIGVAGCTRSMPPDEAESELRPVFQAFKALQPQIVHYKTCSTFDSSPTIGSIGRAIDVGKNALDSAYVPLVVGAPILRRYCVFGNLFASSGLDSEVFRLDRHPTMRSHPTTPMDEADVRLHLLKQTEQRIGLIDVCQLREPHNRIDALVSDGYEVILFDTVSETDLPVVGEAIWSRRASGFYVVGSSGVEYALVAYWRETGEIDTPAMPTVGVVDQIAVTSGSCSPVTAEQIAWAKGEGFALVSMSTKLLVGEEADREVARGANAAAEAVRNGKSVIVHTGQGPGDPRIGDTMEVLRRKGLSDEAAWATTARRIGTALGDVLRAVIEETGLQRVATTGGDTSYYIAKQLGVFALEAIAPVAPGSPLCRVIAPGEAVDGCEVTFKGGQVGEVSFFGKVLAGGE